MDIAFGGSLDAGETRINVVGARPTEQVALPASVDIAPSS